MMRQAKIGEARRAVFGQQDVAGLDVAMNDVEVMRAAQRVGQLQPDRDDLLDRELMLPLEQIGQRSAADVFHDEVVLIVFFQRGQHFDDVGVIEFAQRFAFAPETLDGIWRAGHPVRHEFFDRHRFAGLPIAAQIHPAYCAAADEFFDLIAHADLPQGIAHVTPLVVEVRSRL